jgi:hypothetical protein
VQELCRDNSVTIVSRLQVERPGFDSWEGKGYFSLHHSIQTGSGAHPATYFAGIGGSLPEVKRPGCEVDRPFTSLQCRGLIMFGAIPPIPHTPSWRGGWFKSKDIYTQQAERMTHNSSPTQWLGAVHCISTECDSSYTYTVR